MHHHDHACPETHLDDGNDPVVGDGVGADREMARRVAANDSVDRVPVLSVRLIQVDHGQVRHWQVFSVL